MKRFMFYFGLVLLIFGLGMPLLAQIDSTGVVTIPPAGPGFGFGSLLATAGVTIFITALFNKLLNIASSIWKQIVSWIISIAVIGFANIINIGFAADLTLVSTFIFGLANGLVANGIFDISFVRLLLSFFKLTDAPTTIIESPIATVKGNFQKK